MGRRGDYKGLVFWRWGGGNGKENGNYYIVHCGYIRIIEKKMESSILCFLQGPTATKLDPRADIWLRFSMQLQQSSYRSPCSCMVYTWAHSSYDMGNPDPEYISIYYETA